MKVEISEVAVMKTVRLYRTISKLVGNDITPLHKHLSRGTSTSAAKGDGSADIKPFSEIPKPTGLHDIPYLGIALNFKPFGKHETSQIHFVVDDMIKIHGDMFKLRVGRDYMVFINHPEDAKTVFQSNYDQHKRLHPDLTEITAKRTKLPRSLILLKGKEWVDRRKPAQEKMLRPAVVSSYVPLIEKVTNDLVVELQKKKEVDDLLWEMTNYATESVGMLCFNKRLGCLTSRIDSPSDVALYVARMFECLQISMFSPSKAYLYLRTPLYKRYEMSTLKLSEVVSKEIAEQRRFLAKLEKEGNLDRYLETEPNFMYSLLADGRLSDGQINSVINDLFGAGIDSTANTLVFLLGHLAMNPEKQEKLYAEIKNIFGDSKTLTKDHLAQMSYLKACLKESMRKTFPTSFGSLRILETDTVVGGYHLPKDTPVMINNRFMCMDERFYPRPNEFIPERWQREKNGELSKSKEYMFSHKPFGFGPRSCIGQRFAENEIYIAAAKIIKNFKISMSPDIKEIKYDIRIFTAPTDKVKMRFTER